ncbi:hypothetical protein GGTG_14010 [Gaeumannomyces tritici R3-111a-1]|uniref:Uncharacterized protein n=1 Tax=Gaeumannomyces tritici (strain R3-111a-1) TaxID=644352 RepID=J3PKF5_GAET3|nr:hypothetical protein GGTG_14010 [Gaeumannomyces tritici R3-111a-1]EJT68415.1 hypothetical protein GGTG_14010 [Gaeumannomyces tritici R3-111a-1]
MAAVVPLRPEVACISTLLSQKEMVSDRVAASARKEGQGRDQRRPDLPACLGRAAVSRLPTSFSGQMPS